LRTVSPDVLTVTMLILRPKNLRLRSPESLLILTFNLRKERNAHILGILALYVGGVEIRKYFLASRNFRGNAVFSSLTTLRMVV
jgi:hypothetical protein